MPRCWATSCWCVCFRVHTPPQCGHNLFGLSRGTLMPHTRQTNKSDMRIIITALTLNLTLYDLRSCFGPGIAMLATTCFALLWLASADGLLNNLVHSAWAHRYVPTGTAGRRGTGDTITSPARASIERIKLCFYCKADKAAYINLEICLLRQA